MKVLLFDTTQAYLTPGGKQVHTEKLIEYLPKVGVDVEYARWWDPTQTFDIVHFFSYNAPYVIGNVKDRNKKAVLTQIMDLQTDSSPFQKTISRIATKTIKLLPFRFKEKFYSGTLDLYNAFIYMHKFDKETAIKVFDIDESKTFIIPHASNYVENNYSSDRIHGLPQKYLVSVGTIVSRKRSVVLAKLAKEAKVPVVFVGPGNENDSYYHEFKALIDNEYVFYLGFVDDETKIRAQKNASGYVLLSSAESGCISVYEAASIGLPLLLPNELWAKIYEEPRDLHFCNVNSFETSVRQLKKFFSESERRPYQTIKVHNWMEIAEMYKNVYQAVLNDM